MEKKNYFSERKELMFLYWVLFVTVISLMVSTSYAWFSISRTPRVSNIGLYINAPTGMILSTDPVDGEWVHQLNYAEMVDETAPLRPITWSAEKNQFFAAEYGADGRQTGHWIALSDNQNANRDDIYGYYIKATFYATTDTPIKVSLTDAIEVNEGVDGSGTFLIGSPIWDSKNVLHSDGGNGAQNAMRIGLKITPMVEGAEQIGKSTFIIYEPNADTHVNGLDGYIATPSIDGTEQLVSASKLITQTTTTWTEADPVQRDVVFRDMGDFQTDTYLFSLAAEEIIRIDLYVWLEGQDIDCVNAIGRDAQIVANIQFFADPGGQSGLEPIPPKDDGKKHP